MNRKPKCIIITGRAGAGKTTLAGKLGERLWMPVISRDEIKQGYVNTYGIKHDQLPPDTDGLISDFFFRSCLETPMFALDERSQKVAGRATSGQWSDRFAP